jgi:hypothetical protein
VNKQEETALNELIQELQRMTSGNIAHTRSHCIGLLKDILFLSNKNRAAEECGVAALQTTNSIKPKTRASI